jgi:hypothetical protein
VNDINDDSSDDSNDDSNDDSDRDGPPSEDRVRLELVLFADLVRRLDESGSLLKAVPFLLGRLGDIRRVLFDYEVRSTERLLPIEDPREREARRILREIEERKREMLDEWGEGWTPDDGDDDENRGDAR